MKELKSDYHVFGNKGACWSDKIHIAKSGAFTGRTLCGTPMLSSNWARIWERKDVGCPKCIEIYEKG